MIPEVLERSKISDIQNLDGSIKGSSSLNTPARIHKFSANIHTNYTYAQRTTRCLYSPGQINTRCPANTALFTVLLFFLPTTCACGSMALHSIGVRRAAQHELNIPPNPSGVSLCGRGLDEAGSEYPMSAFFPKAAIQNRRFRLSPNVCIWTPPRCKHAVRWREVRLLTYIRPLKVACVDAGP